MNLVWSDFSFICFSTFPPAIWYFTGRAEATVTDTSMVDGIKQKCGTIPLCYGLNVAHSMQKEKLCLLKFSCISILPSYGLLIFQHPVLVGIQSEMRFM